jgi:copper chaperone CopZ
MKFQSLTKQILKLKMNTMKKFFLLLAIVVSMVAKAQVSKVYLQASGLTCSMCSNAINKALKTLDFVDKIEADVKSYTFEISFKPNTQVDFNKIRKKVEDAGFSVSRFVAGVYFNNVQIKHNEPVTIGNYTLSIINGKDQSLNGIQRVKLLDKGFVSSKEFKSNGLSEAPNNAGLYHVSL